MRKPVAKVIKLRKLSKEQAKKEIIQFIKNRKEADTFDIANELRLDMDLTVKALRELWEEGRALLNEEDTRRPVLLRKTR